MINLLEEHPLTHVKMREDIEYSHHVQLTVARVLAEQVSRDPDTIQRQLDEVLERLRPWTPVTKEGKMSKRMTTVMLKHYAKSVSPTVINGLAAYLGADTPSGEFIFDVDKKLNWANGQFGDAGSCFFGVRAVWDTLRKANGSAIRFWTVKKEDDKPVGAARALIVPTGDGKPVVFNAYGATLAQFASRIEAIDPEAQATPVYTTGRDPVTVNMETGLYVVEKGTPVDRQLAYHLELPDPYEEERKATYCADCGDRLLNNRRHKFIKYDGYELCHVCADTRYHEDVLSFRYYPVNLCVEVMVIATPRELGRGFAMAYSGVLEPVWVYRPTLARINRCALCKNPIHPRGIVLARIDNGEGGYICEVCRHAHGYEQQCLRCGYWRKNEYANCYCKEHRQR